MQHLGEFVVNHWILVALFVVLFGLVFSDFFNNKLSGQKSLNTTQAVQLVNQQKGLFVDIREVAEFEKEHIADSLNLPLSGLSEGMKKLKKPEQPLVLVCASGQRARTAAKQLSGHGFSEIYLLSGGINAWKEAKLPLFK